MAPNALMIDRAVTRRARVVLMQNSTIGFTGSPIMANHIANPLEILCLEGFIDPEGSGIYAEMILENLTIKNHMVRQPGQAGYYLFDTPLDGKKFQKWLKTQPLMKIAV